MLNHETADLDTHPDPTLFSMIRTRYQSIVEDILESEPVAGVTEAILDDFKAKHRSGAFFCRHRKCPRAAQGYNTPELRQMHEESHVPKFQCTEVACGFFGCPFPSRAAIKKHAAQYHNGKSAASIPNFLGRFPGRSHEDIALFTLSNLKTKRRADDSSPPQVGGIAFGGMVSLPPIMTPDTPTLPLSNSGGHAAKSLRTTPSPAITGTTTPISLEFFEDPDDPILGGNPKDHIREMREEQKDHQIPQPLPLTYAPNPFQLQTPQQQLPLNPQEVIELDSDHPSQLQQSFQPLRSQSPPRFRFNMDAPSPLHYSPNQYMAYKPFEKTQDVMM